MVIRCVQVYKQAMQTNNFRTRVTQGIAITLMLLSTISIVQAKQPINKIEISGDGLVEPIEITDPKILDLYTIWFGPKIFAFGVTGAQMIKDGAKSPEHRGWFVDWSQGVVEPPMGKLARYEVKMHMGERGRYYLFLYAIDKTQQSGYIFLPMWRGGTIVHGVELNWLRSHVRWDVVIQPIIKAKSVLAASYNNGSGLDCTVGPAVMLKDGTIKFNLLNDAGKITSRWNYPKSSPQYPLVRAIVGAVEPEQEFMLSCWPPRR